VHVQTENKNGHIKDSFYKELECISDPIPIYYVEILLRFQCKSEERAYIKLVQSSNFALQNIQLSRIQHST
jgi:hypothetical protein